MTLEDMPVELDNEFFTIATRLTQAMELAAKSEIDLAILDLNLAGSVSFPVADILRHRGVPFMFATGYGSHGMTENYRNERVLVKLYGIHQLEGVINKLMSISAV